MTVSFSAYDREQVDYADPYFRMKIWKINHQSLTSEEYGPWHYHEEVEWIAVLKGTMAIETTNHHYPLQGGDVMLLGSNELHRSYKYGTSELIYIVCHVDMTAFMDPSLLTYYAAFTGKSANLTTLYEPLSKSGSKGQALELLNRMLQDITAKKRGYELAVNASFKMLLYTLIQIDDRKVIAPMDPHLAEKLRPALALIEQQLETSCLIADIGKELNYNGSYFSKLFKRGMGMTFTSYVQMRRMKRAAQLLLTESWSVTEISGRVGFASPAQFYQLFRRHFGCSPKQFICRHGRDNGSIGEYSLMQWESGD
ncbi:MULTISPECIES: helix-turn-helix domain-containing protein [unclassified Paenibacillus]|uniref:helix-turn-helix domain-containing protein n=1 Tax=unclassified Paenibacillus TaxID=185978 RepID=UPI0008D47AA6|nr:MULTISPECIES: helix-turn-helix domain-containing protein [unclassified Paenibacillus]QLG39918.1 AraC family transcriptional regulator [Paenibacillus sp. E222]SEN92424.1 AraC-type DNA-binding protein [Paenibacillus sp. OK076]